MRLWSIHPHYLDTKGLVALWREGLLAKKVLEGKTVGYKKHPQLERFKKYSNPIKAINSFLYFVLQEAKNRGYSFDSNKISTVDILTSQISITKGQLEFEFNHLCTKLINRDKEKYEFLAKCELSKITPHPLFFVVVGDIEEWEKTK
jgi:hypothetical protein